MFPKVGKLEQYILLADKPTIHKHLPATAPYSKENLLHFLNQFDVVYIKHDTSGQGRGVYKVTKGLNNFLILNGFSMEGNVVNQEQKIHQIHKILHPFERLGRLHPYIIQEGIQSETTNGQPLNIRVHVQCIKGDWMVGGMYASIGFDRLEENGVINIRRGSHALSIQELMQHYLGLDPENEKDLMDKIINLSIAASEAVARNYQFRECGIDIGVDQQLNPVIFEVNTTPGIGGFYLVDKKLWQHIIDIRKSL